MNTKERRGTEGEDEEREAGWDRGETAEENDWENVEKVKAGGVDLRSATNSPPAEYSRD